MHVSPLANTQIQDHLFYTADLEFQACGSLRPQMWSTLHLKPTKKHFKILKLQKLANQTIFGPFMIMK